MEQAHNNIDVTLVCPGPVYSKIAEEAFTGKADKVCFMLLSSRTFAFLVDVFLETRSCDAVQWEPNDDGAMFWADDARHRQ